MRVRILLFIGCLLMNGLAIGNSNSNACYDSLLQHKVRCNETKAHCHLYPCFQHAHVCYPPKKIALLVFKSEKVVELWAKSSKDGDWAYIRDFPVLAASGRPGPKLRAGDRQVPEGIYNIVALNPASNYDLSMMVNYPNAFDREHARMDHRHNLGRDIFIHGSDVSWGCIALGNKNIEDLFVLAYKVGIENITVIIAPNDLRREGPIESDIHPDWIAELDEELARALKPFNLAKKYQEYGRKVVATLTW